ncbi:hypothetical protein [Priestia koreensis]|uniref:hypothetical protein n=1 Tax=Priestia koreensis TaxID=284581 RepID=UPI0034586D35
MNRGAWSGAIAGLILGLFLKMIQFITGEKVYTLLLNVDFIPVIGNVDWPEVVEFLFHLIIAVMIGLVFGGVLQFKKWETLRMHVLIAACLTIPTIFLYFPLTLLAHQATPGVWNGWALFYWTFGHALFMIVLLITYRLLMRKKASSA